MLGNMVKDAFQRSRFECFVPWNGYVKLPFFQGNGHADMAARLPRASVSELLQHSNEIRRRNVSGELHAAITSSRVKCRRMILGRF